MNIAVHHLEKFSSSRANLRRVLERRVFKARALRDDAPSVEDDEAATWIAEVLDTLERQGLLDDTRYAEGAARGLARQGQSQRAIRARLAAKGVDRDIVDTALERAAEDVFPHAQTPPDPDLVAAVTYARRRRLGPWRLPEARAERRDRDLAALARRGFSSAIAHRVIDAEDVDAAEDLMDPDR